ncbi:MAG: DEAD/DEAH box helicase family protein [Pirellulaceae bacterium]
MSSLNSKNFEFLRRKWEALAALAAFAERYADADPASALVKLRSFAEEIVQTIFHSHGLVKPPQANLHDLLTTHSFSQIVPRVVISKLHSLRIQGNKAAHGEQFPANAAKLMLKEAFELARWFYIAFDSGKLEDCPQYAEPVPGELDEATRALKREKRAILEHLAAQEARMKDLLTELDEARVKAQKAESSLAEIETAMAVGQQTADLLHFDEETTRRRLIDTQLVAAGWDVGPNGASTTQVGQEVEIDHQPTETGIGYGDYVLWGDDGKPMAVVEAKKTAVDPEVGRKQAECYADGLEKTYGQRPVIFYTNGYETSIWNDAEGEPPRRLYGFYTKDSLEYLILGRTRKDTPKDIAPNPDIADRMYQIEAVKRVSERFAGKHRKALIVQATGTGKTRVAISLCDALIRAKWARRILFLCDRRELRKQAKGVFQEYLSGEPLVYVTARTYQDREHRIYLATYPAMMKVFESFDVGFFDLIIADESHRSIYNRYRDLIEYFDAYKVGLTATPVKYISRNTYSLFGCQDEDPTAHFSFTDAINHNPPYLCPFKVKSVTTHFLREGIKYSQMTKQQRGQLEQDEEVPQAIEYEQHQVDRHIFNKDTNRTILQNIMDNSVRDGTGSYPGKTIVFARNHDHALLLQKLFDEMYPNYGGKFCRVIDNYEPRAEQLIDEFKDPLSGLNIAISVDMLDTGVDVPEIVNLVFAKPVFSFVKFWQMIGRGTRLCENLFGPGKHKTHFLIFDHWGNFQFFEEEYEEAEPARNKSLLQRLFEARIDLAEMALDQGDLKSFDLVAGLVGKDIADLPDKSIAVRDRWKEVHTVKNDHALRQFSPATRALLRQDIAPLMDARNIMGHEPAYQFDQLICKLQAELLKSSASFDDLKADLLALLDDLPMNLNQVRQKAHVIQEVRSTSFWDNVTVARLDRIRQELRGLARYRQSQITGRPAPKVIDIGEEDDLIERQDYKPRLEGLELAAYRRRVESVLKELFEQNETLRHIKDGDPVSDDDLRSLCSLVLTQDPDLDLQDLLDYYPETAGHLDLAIRTIIGLDPAAVQQRFSEFVQRHTTLNSMQIKFLSMLQNHIAKYGSIELDRLYEEPFTSFAADGIDGVFDEPQIDDLLKVIVSFNPPKPPQPTK